MHSVGVASAKSTYTRGRPGVFGFCRLESVHSRLQLMILASAVMDVHQINLFDHVQANCDECILVGGLPCMALHVWSMYKYVM